MKKYLISFLGLLIAVNALAVGKIQNEDVKTLAQLLSAGGVMSQLINDTKIYVTAKGLNEQLSTAIENGDIGSGGGGGGGVSLLTGSDNPGFESCSGATCPGWTASGGTVATETTSPLFGSKSAKFTASASSQTFSSNAKSIPVGLQGDNCLGVIGYKYSGSSGDYSLQIYDGSNVLASTSLDVATSTNTAYAGFTCPTSGTVLLRIISNVSSPGTITLDGAASTGGIIHLGSNLLLAKFTQAQMVGSSYFLSASNNCNWTNSSTSMAAFTADTDCPGPTVEHQFLGDWQTTNTFLPEQTINNLPAGIYRVTWYSQMNCDNASCVPAITLSDGTTIAQTTVASDISSGAANTYVSVSGIFSYSTAGNRTFKVYGQVDNGAYTLHIPNGLPFIRHPSFIIEKFPSVADTVIQGIETTGWYVDANISSTDSSNIDLGTGAQSSYVGMSNANLEIASNSGSIGVQIPCTGTNPSTGSTCSAGNEMAGVVFDLPKAGAVMACASFTVSLYPSQTIFQIVETPNNAQTILQEGHTKIGGTTSDIGFRNCGVFVFDSAGQKTLRLMYEQPALAGNPLVYVDLDSARGQRDMHWEVYPINQQVPMPYLVRQLQSSSTAIMQHSTAYITNTGSPVITRQDGSFITSLTDNGAGDVSVNFSASAWSSVPNCSCGGVEASGDTDTVSCSVSKATTPSSSTYRFKTRLGGTLTDRDFTISCTGPKQ